MNSKVAKTDYFKLGTMSILCLITLENGYEIVGVATKKIANEADEEEARGIAYQKAMFKLVELEAVPDTPRAGITPTV
jgi:hypothetical protein